MQLRTYYRPSENKDGLSVGWRKGLFGPLPSLRPFPQINTEGQIPIRVHPCNPWSIFPAVFPTDYTDFRDRLKHFQICFLELLAAFHPLDAHGRRKLRYRPRADPTRCFASASCRLAFGEPSTSSALVLPLPAPLSTDRRVSWLTSRGFRGGRAGMPEICQIDTRTSSNQNRTSRLVNPWFPGTQLHPPSATPSPPPSAESTYSPQNGNSD